MKPFIDKQAPLAKILIVDDKPANLIAFESVLNALNVEIIMALSGEQALLQLLEHEIAVILLDIQMPGMDGFETAELIRGNAATKGIPIIFITANNENKQTIFKGYESGAVDLLFKPVDSIVLKSKVAVFVNLYHQTKTIEIQKEKIVHQHATQIEEERLKVILQMAGATAHEMNQPLMIMMGNIELLEMDNFAPESVKKFAPRIKESAQRLSDTVKKIQAIDSYKTKRHDEKTYIMDLDNKIRILYVEKNTADFQKIAQMLKDNTKMKLFRTQCIATAFQELEEKTFDVILVDSYLPEGTATDFIEEINNRQIATPVICITDHGNDEIAAKVLRCGAYDYLSTSDLDKEILINTIKGAFEKFRLKTDLKLAMKKMADMSTRDTLTGLNNRRHLNEVMDQEFSRALRYENPLSCIFFDLDYFKTINDNFGYACGDFVLKEFASTIMKHKRDSDYAFRYGGEEFLLLLPRTSQKEACIIGKNLLQYCRNHHYNYDNQSFIVTMSLGIASVMDCNPQTGEDLLAFADKALYQAKMDGRNCLRVFKQQNKSSRISNRIQTEKGFAYLNKEHSRLLTKTKNSIIKSLEMLTHEACGAALENETQRIKVYIELFCKKLGLPEPIVHSIQNAASLINYSKIMLGDTLLFKKEALNKKEIKKIEQLPDLQVRMANQFELFKEEKKILRHNRQWFDRSVCSEEKSADEIPLEAKIFSIINAFVAMTSNRTYRKKFSNQEAVLEIIKKAGTQFDPVLVDFFIDTVIENNLLDISEGQIETMKKIIHKKRSQRFQQSHKNVSAI